MIDPCCGQAGRLRLPKEVQLALNPPVAFVPLRLF
jgi:hypothetical protein